MLKLFTLCIKNIKNTNKLLYGEKKQNYYMERGFWDTLYIYNSTSGASSLENRGLSRKGSF